MKKLLCSLGLSFGLISGAFAVDNTLDLLNLEIANILSPFQNQATVAKLKFDAVEIDKERASKVALNSLYNKVGSKNNFEVKVDNLSYDYGNGTSPTTVLKGSVGLDLTKFLTPQESNQIIPSAIEFLQELVKSYTEEYGDAIFIKGVVTSTTKDADGNYTGLTALISTKIDLDKLPEDLSRESVMITDAFVSVTLNLKSGFALDAFVVSNPEYWGFQENQIGLKEILEHLLARDEEAIEMINTLFINLDFMASNIVEIDNESFWNLISKNNPILNHYHSLSRH
ncbi:hypothetical protein OQJ19_14685 [Fluoribacter gormanii]|uniref:Uncharacterized protein n=1 Tax=Fluoribacter gormanii TaxID=464 RepID=A0A377GKC2_9GAMM|nr:hypothetical protein [Fluoribacter gormanii]KTD00866.1 hypothetical protein Lgor_2783 [Fluoribacter gormanii]MCW8443448.1 hypothetical protein [Fluoribacter gormanii]MCW8471875.1 hypothetical protein [Fluoribacter gormanii]SIQ80873.1 hypothetical protein SAMN05421777_103123 [Fluoribacter gormanii]STO25013.1 Uncharacterised protein [Fluoribacter gormanii]